jgi:hypothetical protein
MPMRLKDFNKAIERFARKHGYSVKIVRTNTELRMRARAEWWAR